MGSGGASAVHGVSRGRDRSARSLTPEVDGNSLQLPARPRAVAVVLAARPHAASLSSPHAAGGCRFPGVSPVNHHRTREPATCRTQRGLYDYSCPSAPPAFSPSSRQGGLRCKGDKRGEAVSLPPLTNELKGNAVARTAPAVQHGSRTPPCRRTLMEAVVGGPGRRGQAASPSPCL